jgi:hypothetical protein
MSRKDKLAAWKSEMRLIWATGTTCDRLKELKRDINALAMEIREEDLNGQSETEWKHMMEEDELTASATLFALKQDYAKDEDGDVHWWLDTAHSLLVADRYLHSGARALLAMGRAVAAGEGSRLLDEAEIRVRDVVVWRCHATAPDNRSLFEDNLMTAFGDELTGPLRSRLLNAHRRCVFDRVKNTFQSNGLQTRLKRGQVRPSRHKTPGIGGVSWAPPGLRSEFGKNKSVPWLTPLNARLCL